MSARRPADRPRARRAAPRVAVVGGGLAGLAAARELAAAGLAVRVLDKGRAPSGRASTRRRDGWSFDHGAQYLTARAPRFVREVEGWLRAGVVAPWRGRIVALGPDGARPAGGGDPRYVGTPGMSAIARHLARGLEVHSGVRVARAARDAAGWALAAEDGADLGRCEALLVTAPAPQAAALLGHAPELAARAGAVRMRPCVAALLGLERAFAAPFDGAFVDGGPLSWVARDSSKPGRPAGDAWVLHAGPEWSEEHFDDPPEAQARALEAALEERAGLRLPTVVHRDVMRWRYALADPPLEVGALYDPALAVGVAGDWCHGSRVEGALLSGLELAARLLARLP